LLLCKDKKSTKCLMIFIFMYIDEIGKKIFDFLSLILRTIVFALELWQQTVLCRSQSQISYLT
ncbi:hypothetical protein ABTF62_20250, partial [Acinetobacter baumannii]